MEIYLIVSTIKRSSQIWQDQSCPQNEALTLQALVSQGMVHPDEKSESDTLGLLCVDEPHGEGGGENANQWNPKYG
jgi:hypothetical protein